MLYPLFFLYSLPLISTMYLFLVKHLLAHCCTKSVNGGIKTCQEHLEILLDIQSMACWTSLHLDANHIEV